MQLRVIPEIVRWDSNGNTCIYYKICLLGDERKELINAIFAFNECPTGQSLDAILTGFDYLANTEHARSCS
jgi:hypothetical protein